MFPYLSLIGILGFPILNGAQVKFIMLSDVKKYVNGYIKTAYSFCAHVTKTPVSQTCVIK